jgi:hypothetical protein
VQSAFSRYAGAVVFTFRSNRLGSVGAWIWNRGQDLWALSVPVLIVLKLTGVIAWSWSWVLSPLWISGILIAPVLCALLVLLGRHMFRRAASSEELAAERYRVELRKGYPPAVMVGKSDVPGPLINRQPELKVLGELLTAPVVHAPRCRVRGVTEGLLKLLAVDQ